MVRGHSELLMPMVEAVMHESGLGYSDLDKIAVTVGPGAFTGLRIGLSTAKAMAMALQVPAVGLTTLDILARQFREQQPSACAVLIETKRDDYYVGVYNAQGMAVREPAAMSGAATAELLKEYPDIVLTGDAVERFSSAHAGHAAVPALLPDAKLMCVMADVGLGGEPEPLYLRGADVTMPKQPPRTLID